jgi:hypothetical protein
MTTTTRIAYLAPIETRRLPWLIIRFLMVLAACVGLCQSVHGDDHGDRDAGPGGEEDGLPLPLQLRTLQARPRHHVRLITGERLM